MRKLEKINPDKLHSMSSKQLLARKEAINKAQSIITMMFIDNGMGSLRHSDILARREEGGLFEDHCHTSELWRQICDEESRRMVYHGTTKPIK